MTTATIQTDRCLCERERSVYPWSGVRLFVSEWFRTWVLAIN